MKFLFILFFSFFIVSCSCSGGRNKTDLQFASNMMKQNAIKAQEGSDSGKLLMREPPLGSKARNRSYYPFTKDPIKAGKKLKNPLPRNPQVISMGRAYYERYCIYCHGKTGDGLGGATVAPKMVIKPPSLLTKKARSYSDGRIFHIIYNGQGFMGSYKAQLNTNEQELMDHYVKGKGPKKYVGSKRIWSVVRYIRALQQDSK